MHDTKPSDFVSISDWCTQFGGDLLNDPKLLHYHTKPIQRELMSRGALARVGRLVFLHKTLFWSAFQSIQAQKNEVDQWQV